MRKSPVAYRRQVRSRARTIVKDAPHEESGSHNEREDELSVAAIGTGPSDLNLKSGSFRRQSHRHPGSESLFDLFDGREALSLA